MGGGEGEWCRLSSLSVGAEDRNLHWGRIQVEHGRATRWGLTYSEGTSRSLCVLGHIIEPAEVSLRAALSWGCRRKCDSHGIGGHVIKGDSCGRWGRLPGGG